MRQRKKTTTRRGGSDQDYIILTPEADFDNDDETLLLYYRYDEDENAVVAEYTYEDAPKPVRTFSKLKLYGALTQAGLWDTFEAWLKTQTINGVNAYTAFSLAQDLNDANELFNGVVESAKTALGVSDEVVEMILEASVADM